MKPKHGGGWKKFSGDKFVSNRVLSMRIYYLRQQTLVKDVGAGALPTSGWSWLLPSLEMLEATRSDSNNFEKRKMARMTL